MATTQPGLAPRENRPNEVVQNVELQEPAMPTDSEQPGVEAKPETHVSDNTEATEREIVRNEDSKEPQSERAERRMQDLANARREAEERAVRAEQLLSRLVSNQPQQPTLSDEQLIAKQFKSYDENAGYPTDPREYTQYNAAIAEMRAEKRATSIVNNANEQSQIAALHKAYPDADDAMIGAIAAERQAAARRGEQLTYVEAAERAESKLTKRYAKKLSEQTERDTRMKNEAYVEETKGASSTRGSGNSKVNPEDMSLEEKEAWLKENNAW